MSMNITMFNVRIDKGVKSDCEKIYNELGINLTTAINVFLRKSISVGGFPFDVKIDNYSKETLEAMSEAKRISSDPNVKSYSSAKEIVDDLKED